MSSIVQYVADSPCLSEIAFSSSAVVGVSVRQKLLVLVVIQEAVDQDEIPRFVPCADDSLKGASLLLLILSISSVTVDRSHELQAKRYTPVTFLTRKALLMENGDTRPDLRRALRSASRARHET